MKRNYWNCGLSEWFVKRFIFNTEKVRARDKKGQYVGDDKTAFESTIGLTCIEFGRRMGKVDASKL